MIPIHKNPPPNSLSQYHRDPNASFDNMSSATKNELRESLLNEQGAICCYCMSRIGLQKSRIEHWLCQSDNSDRELEYTNMMLACHGNEGEISENQHCDVKKGDLPLKFNPLNPNHAQRLKIRYLGNGTVESDDSDFNAQLENVLNLNFAALQAYRKEVYKAVIKTLDKKGWNRRTIDNEIQKYQQFSQGQRQPFCGVVLYHLEKWRRKYL